jgi:hypothetical protein
MVTRGIRAFVKRDWDRVRENKESYWAERIARLGAAEGLRAAEQLRLQMRSIDPAWPHDEDRQADLCFHADLSHRMRRAGATRRR